MLNPNEAKKLFAMADQDYGNGEEMHDDQYNGNGNMDGYDQQNSNGGNDNTGRDDDR